MATPPVLPSVNLNADVSRFTCICCSKNPRVVYNNTTGFQVADAEKLPKKWFCCVEDLKKADENIRTWEALREAAVRSGVDLDAHLGIDSYREQALGRDLKPEEFNRVVSHVRNAASRQSMNSVSVDLLRIQVRSCNGESCALETSKLAESVRKFNESLSEDQVTQVVQNVLADLREQKRQELSSGELHDLVRDKAVSENPLE